MESTVDSMTVILNTTAHETASTVTTVGAAASAPFRLFTRVLDRTDAVLGRLGEFQCNESLLAGILIFLLVWQTLFLWDHYQSELWQAIVEFRSLVLGFFTRKRGKSKSASHEGRPAPMKRVLRPPTRYNFMLKGTEVEGFLIENFQKKMAEQTLHECDHRCEF